MEAKQEHTRLNMRNGLIVGITLFSMFFGAGNLILAPRLGVQAGIDTPLALAGFIISAVGLPVLTIAAVAMAGTARDLCTRIHPRFSEIFMALNYLAIGPCLAIPRTASTSFAMLDPFLPQLDDTMMMVAQLAFTLVFFVVAYLLAMNPSRLTQLMGKISGPALIALIIIVVGVTLVDPPATTPTAAVAPYNVSPVLHGFTTGYQTMDMLAGLAFGLVVAMNISELGLHEPKHIARQVIRSGVVAGVLMGIIYVGFGVVGMIIGPQLGGVSNGADVISAAADLHFGVVGSVIVAAIFGLACLNVCIGLISSIGEYFYQTYGKISYRQWALLIAVVSAVFANFGLATILNYSVPVLSALYPVAIVVVLMGLIPGSTKHLLAWKVTVGVCSFLSVIIAFRDGFMPKTWLPSDMLPLAALGMAWLVPTIIAYVFGSAGERLQNKV